MTEEKIRLCKECEWFETINCPLETAADGSKGICLPVRRLKACERSLEETVKERDKLQEENELFREDIAGRAKTIERAVAERDKLKQELDERKKQPINFGLKEPFMKKGGRNPPPPEGAEPPPAPPGQRKSK